VLNCTGLGAKALFDDDELMPVKGQLTFLLPQPECSTRRSRSDGILLGGTHEEGVWSLAPNLRRKAELLAAHKAFFDGFRG